MDAKQFVRILTVSLAVLLFAIVVISPRSAFGMEFHRELHWLTLAGSTYLVGYSAVRRNWPFLLFGCGLVMSVFDAKIHWLGYLSAILTLTGAMIYARQARAASQS